MVGLTRAFIYAGSPSVIASLWSVDDEATRALMVSFYSHLGKGLPQADALRLAQIDVRRDYPHPYYWAGFVLTGDPGAAAIPNTIATTSH
jgi:CHAT domain-containing protein